MLVSLFVAYASSDGLPSSQMENNALEMGFVVATALRLASLRNSQIALAAREGAVLVPTLTKPILVLAGSLGLGFGILYWYPRLLMYLFFAGLVVGGFYTYRDKRNAIDTLRNVFLFALTFLYHLSAATSKKTSQPTSSPRQPLRAVMHVTEKPCGSSSGEFAEKIRPGRTTRVKSALNNRYEAERYGLQPAREEEVSALAG